jgi:CheY-like chemotaxis protein
MKCLLIDDETGIREGLAALLRLKGHEVRTAAAVREGLRQLDAQAFDLVITDWRLPDGVAEDVVRAAGCPVVAVSGHPEEVTRLPNLRDVLTKPVLPQQLFEILEHVAVSAAAAETTAGGDVFARLPLDVRELFGAALGLLDASEAELLDDGTFATLRAPLSDDTLLPRLELLGGDLRVLTPDGTPWLELRCYRDGRPSGSVIVVPAGGDWPAAGEVAVDFDRTTLGPEGFLEFLDAAAGAAAIGRTVHFLNVPGHLRFFAEVSGRGRDMPKRARPGPRLAADVAHLWS